MRWRSRTWLRRLGIGLVLLLLAFGAYVLYALYLAGSFRRIEPHFAGSCHAVAGIAGVADIVIAPDGRHAFLSADDRRAAAAGRPAPGAIWLYDLASETLPINLTPDATAAFHPQGISLWPLADGRGRLFVVDHPDEGRMPPGQGRQTVDVFDWNGESLAYRATLADPLLANPNSIAAVGVDRFYVSNGHRWHGFWRAIEQWLRLPLADIVYFDGAKFRVAADGIALAAGIAASADGRRLFVAATAGRALLVYDRDPATAALGNRREVALDSAPDAITRSADGSLWIGAHPQFLKYLAHARKAKNRSPSQVLKLAPKADGGFAVTEVYLDDGRAISGAAVGAAAGKRLLIGPRFDDHFLDCRMQ
ncbi:MAG TPA: SMP-30/gluconolactonase/LRE family protein [Candidatus Sulfotelmatobacter sp.]|nr:SMP-30/gluconolactonase/LRE family protein [Candidatus Sulfotelmatobacter sp.]